MNDFKIGDLVQYRPLLLSPNPEMKIIMSVCDFENSKNPILSDDDDVVVHCRYFRNGDFHIEKFRMAELVLYRENA